VTVSSAKRVPTTARARRRLRGHDEAELMERGQKPAVPADEVVCGGSKTRVEKGHVEAGLAKTTGKDGFP